MLQNAFAAGTLLRAPLWELIALLWTPLLDFMGLLHGKEKRRRKGAGLPPAIEGRQKALLLKTVYCL